MSAPRFPFPDEAFCPECSGGGVYTTGTACAYCGGSGVVPRRCVDEPVGRYLRAVYIAERSQNGGESRV